MKKNKVLIIVIILLMILSVVLFFVFKKNSYNHYDYENVKGYSFTASDGSYIVFNDDFTFYWYEDKDNLEDNYYYGTYTIKRGENAIKYINDELAIYSVTEEEQRNLLDRKNEDNAIDLYYNWNLHNEKLVTNGEKQSMDRDTHYYGFASINYEIFDLVNMTSSNYATFFR